MFLWSHLHFNYYGMVSCQFCICNVLTGSNLTQEFGGGRMKQLFNISPSYFVLCTCRIHHPKSYHAKLSFPRVYFTTYPALPLLFFLHNIFNLPRCTSSTGRETTLSHEAPTTMLDLRNGIIWIEYLAFRCHIKTTY